MSLMDFKVLEKLGSGAYSSVYRVERLLDNEIYALKKVNLSGMTPKEQQNALNEVRILASIRHPGVIGYREAFLDENTKSLW
jgi:NIMA (never in mitosis gene a)-related kinase